MNSTNLYTKSSKGFTLFEVAVFLIIFSLALALYVQSQYIERYSDSASTLSMSLRAYTKDFKQYLIDHYEKLNDGVTEIPLSQLIQSGIIGSNATGLIGNYALGFYAKKQIINEKQVISGLVTMSTLGKTLPIPVAKSDYIEGLLAEFGGRRVKNTDIVNGNWGAWVLNLKEWNTAEKAQIFSYIPDVLDFSNRRQSAQVPSKVRWLSFENCSFGQCTISELPVNKMLSTSTPVEWKPFYNEDYLRIFISGDTDISYYLVTLTVKSSISMTTSTNIIATTSSGITLFAKDYNNIEDEDISIAILPITSHGVGDEFCYNIHKTMPKKIISNLWSSIDIEIRSDAPLESPATGRCQLEYPYAKLVNVQNGVLNYVEFVAKSPFTLAYDVTFSFFGNNFYFPKNGQLSLFYAYSDTFYPWFFINHPNKNSGGILSCMVEGSTGTYVLPDAEVIVGDKKYLFDNHIRMTAWNMNAPIVHITYNE